MMDVDLDELLTTITNIKCMVCDLVVSVAPVMIISEDGLQLRCGRCKAVKGKTIARNMLYESIAKSMTFPCIYAKCKEKIPWGQVEKHEKVCQFRMIPCPVYYQSCTALVEVESLQSHFEEKHKENIYKEFFSYELKVSEEIICLFVQYNVQFLVYIVCSSQFVSTAVFSLHPTDKFSHYNITLGSSNNIDCLISYKKQEIISFNEKEHCFKCWKQKCQLKYHPYSQAFGSHYADQLDLYYIGSKFERTSILNLLKNPDCIIYTIDLVPNELESEEVTSIALDKDDENLMTNKVKYYNNNNLLRQNLECSICEEYMLLPIFTCKTGHTICNVCKLRLENCPYCKQDITDARNFALENMAEQVELPCQYEKQGCTFIGNVERLREHELNCSLKSKS